MSTRVATKTMKEMVMVKCFGLMVPPIKVNGGKAFNMERER